MSYPNTYSKLKTFCLFFFLFYSLNSFSQWFSQAPPNTISFHSIVFPSNTIGYMAGGSEIYKSTNGGVSWVILGYPLPTFNDSLFWQGKVKDHLFFTSLDTGFAAGWDIWTNTSIILKTVDGGATWVTKHTGSPNCKINSIFFPSATIGYAVGNNGTIYKTTNAGNNWTSFILTSTTEEMAGLYFVDNNIGYVVSGTKTYKTINGGSNWTIVNSLGGTCVWFQNSQIGYVGTSGGTVRKTTNFGSSWVTCNFGNNTQVNKLFFTNDSIGYATTGLSQYGKIYKTKDYGMHWEPQPSSDGEKLSDICFTDDNKGFSVGDNGRIIHTTNAGGLNAPVAFYTNDNPNFCNSITNFTNLGLTSNNYSWLVNNNIISNTYNFSYAFSEATSYTLSLIADNGNYTDTLQTNFTTPNNSSINFTATVQSDSLCIYGSTNIYISNSENDVVYNIKNGTTYLTTYGLSGNGGGAKTNLDSVGSQCSPNCMKCENNPNVC